MGVGACSGAFAGLAGFVSGLGLWVGDLVGLWALFLACRLWALLPGLCWALVGACDFVGAWAFAVLVGACKGAFWRSAFAYGRLRALLLGLWALLLGFLVGFAGIVGVCGRLWVGALAALAGLAGLVAQHLWVGPFAGLLLLGFAGAVARLCGRCCWDCGAGLWALLLACGRLLALVRSWALLQCWACGRFCWACWRFCWAWRSSRLVGFLGLWVLVGAFLVGLWRPHAPTCAHMHLRCPARFFPLFPPGRSAHKRPHVSL